MILLQVANFIPPVLLQYTVGLLYPFITILSTPNIGTMEGKTTPVVRLIITLSMRSTKTCKKE